MDKIRYFCDTCGDEIEDIGSAITVPCGCGCSDRFCNQECMERFEGHEQDVEEWEGVLEMEKREDRIRAYEEKGCTRSDAQAVVDAEDADLSPNGYSSKTIEAEENEGRVV